MTDSNQLKAFQQLKALIADQLQWGDSESWSNYDFEKLADKVQEKTGVTLSVSTLKRIFGRVNYQSAPSLTTLNTLSQFTGFEDWRSFMNSINIETPAVTNTQFEVPVESPLATPKNPTAAKPANGFSFLKVTLLFAAVLLVAFVTISFFSRKEKPAPAAFSFSSKTMLTEGLPNSVVFDYNASAAGDRDSLFIVQSWDTRRKTLVNKNDRHHSSIYYYPGYFRAKLMIGNEIVREHDLQIKTEGWLGLIEAEWKQQPLYFTKEEITKGNEISIDEALLKKYNVALLPTPPPVRFFNQQDIHGITTDNFTFETEIKTDFANGCQRAEVLLQSKNDILIIPLVNKACIGDIYLAAYGFYTTSTKENLSGFGCNLKEWTKLKVVCINRDIRFFINDTEVFAATVKNEPTEIVGAQYRFDGTGAVRNTILSGTDNKVVKF